jgi:hypothetical protein
LTTLPRAPTITTHSKKKKPAKSSEKSLFFSPCKIRRSILFSSHSYLFIFIQNEQIFYCNCTKDSDPASHKISLVKGPAAEYFRAYSSIPVSCPVYFLSSYTFQTS